MLGSLSHQSGSLDQPLISCACPLALCHLRDVKSVSFSVYDRDSMRAVDRLFVAALSLDHIFRQAARQLPSSISMQLQLFHGFMQPVLL